MREENITRLQDTLSHRFADPSLLRQALTHKSYANEQRLEPTGHNERLEFLGDTILDFVISDFLMRLMPGSPEGELSKLRAVVVSEPNLARVAGELGLGECLLLGRGEEQTGGRKKSSLLANALEALIAALYMDGGMDVAYRFVMGRFEDDVRRMSAGGAVFDFKTELQELCQGRFGELPEYRVTSESGPDHLKVFEVEIIADGKRVGTGSGGSKKEAEQLAAKMALESLRSEPAG